MIVQWLIIATFWLSYVAITFASVITIADFVDRIQQSRKARKLHSSEGLIEVNRLPDEEQEKH